MDDNQRKWVHDWIQKPSDKPKLILIYGPTASWKSARAVEVAELLQNQGLVPFVVSVDARQIYRGLNIGTGKIPSDEMRGIPHHMLDIIDPSERFSVVDFRNRVEEIPEWKIWKKQFPHISENFSKPDITQKQEVQGKRSHQNKEIWFEDTILSQGEFSKNWEFWSVVSKWVYWDVNEWEINFVDAEIRSFSVTPTYIPILCWGTGLYIDSLIFERSYPEIEADWNLREELERFRLEYGNQALWQKLSDIDPGYASELHPNNYHYVIRGIEVMMKTWTSKRDIQDTPALKYDTLFLTPYQETQLSEQDTKRWKIPPERQELYDRIDTRIEKMFNDWLIEEVWYNMDIFTSSAPGLRTIGYKEVVDYLEWRISLDECKNLVKQHNRNYAKRQVTWNKKYE